MHPKSTVIARACWLFLATLTACGATADGAPADGDPTGVHAGAVGANREYRGYYIYGAANGISAAHVADPLVAGVGLAGLYWGKIQSGYGAFDWDLVDKALSLVDPVNKNLILRIIVGRKNTSDASQSTLPSWLFTAHGGMPAAEAFCYDGKWCIPTFWDPTFERDWRQFVQALAARYNGKKNIIVMASGPWKAFGENYLPGCAPADQDQWVQRYRAHTGNPSATLADVRNAYDAFLVDWLFPLYANSFTGGQPLAMGQGLGLCDSTALPSTDPDAHPHGRYVDGEARNAYGGFSGTNQRGFFTQYNGLAGTENDFTTWMGNSFGPVSGVVSRGVIGYQSVGGTEPFCSSNQCVQNDKFDEELGIAVKYAASYLEVYYSDFKAALDYASYPAGSIERAGAEHIRAALITNQPKLHTTRPQTITLLPEADAFVQASFPNANYGTSSLLETDADPIVRSLVRFNVTGVTGTVTRATLRIYAEAANTYGFELASVADNSWGEATVTFDNAPAAGVSLGRSGGFEAGTWIEFDVTPLVTGGGARSFIMWHANASKSTYSSREGSHPPQLVVEQG